MEMTELQASRQTPCGMAVEGAQSKGRNWA